MDTGRVFISVFLIAVLIVSFSAVYAGEGVQKMNGEKERNEYEYGYELTHNYGMDMNRVSEQQRTVERERERINYEISAISDANIIPEVARVKEKYLVQKRDYLDSRENYLEAKEGYVIATNAVVAYKERLRAAEPDEKNEVRREFSVKARNYLVSQSDVLSKQLRIFRDNNILNGEVSDAIGFYERKRERIRDGNFTDDELVDASKEMKNHWNELRKRIKLNLGKALNNRINTIVKKGGQFSERFGAMIGKLAEEGKDTNRLERGLGLFNNDLNRFQMVYEELRQEYQDANSVSNADTVLRKGNRLLTAMNHRLMDDFHLMKRLFYHYKLIQQGHEADSTQLDAAIEQMENDTSLDIVISEEIAQEGD
ncbi:MAG: hypothetical protein ABID38_07210 [Candidatus Diapherotrites archaeon]